MRSFLLSLVILFFAGTYGMPQQPTFITNPDDIAGRWETPDGQGGYAGMHIRLATGVDPSAKTMVAQPQGVMDFIAALYRRTSPEVDQLQFHFFTVSFGTDVARWDGQRLKIHLDRKDAPVTNINLTWNQDTHEWTGLFEYDSIREQVTLKRPASLGATSPFVGTWAQSQGGSIRCVHIAQQADGAFTAWSDNLRLPWRERYAKQVQPPPYIYEGYGEPAKVKTDSPDSITVTLNAYSAGCCYHSFSAKVSADGTMLAGVWSEGPNQGPGSNLWKKVSGNSCIEGATH